MHPQSRSAREILDGQMMHRSFDLRLARKLASRGAQDDKIKEMSCVFEV